MIEKIIFDLDGTLVDTLGGIGASVNHVLEKYGYPTRSIDHYQKIVGYGLDKTMMGALPASAKDQYENFEKVIDEMVEALVAYYESNPIKDTSLYPGIQALINALEARGIYWGVHTNKRASVADLVGNHYFGGPYYLGLIGPKDGMPLKPDPTGTLTLMGKSPSTKVLFIGDTEVDALTAQAAGVTPILVSWGFRKKEELEKLGHPVIDRPSQILDFLGSL